MPKPLIAISRRQALLFAGFLVSYQFLTYIANDMILPGMLQVVRDFHAQESMVATAMTVYMLGGASLQIILGPLSDSYGRRSWMLVGAVLFVVFTLLIANSNSMTYFLIARFFQGMGLCFIGVIGYTTIQEIFSEMDAVRAIAVMANVAVLAPLLGPISGALIIHYHSWRVIFDFIGIGAIIVFFGLWQYMPEPLGKKKLDGQVIEKIPFSFKKILESYGLLLTNPSFLFSAIATALVGIPCVGWIGIAPLILMAEGKLSVIQYGLWQLPVFGATVVGNWTLHWLTYKYDLRHLINLGIWMCIFGTSLCALLPLIFGNHYIWLIPGIIFYFFSLSIIVAPLNRYCLFVTHISKGTASALISLLTMLLGALGVEGASLIYRHSNFNFGLYCIGIMLLTYGFIYFSFRQVKPETLRAC